MSRLNFISVICFREPANPLALHRDFCWKHKIVSDALIPSDLPPSQAVSLNIKHSYVALIPRTRPDLQNSYEVLPQNSGNLTIKKFLALTPSFQRLLRSSPLGHVYSHSSVFPTISCIPGSSQICVDNLLRFCVDLLSRVKTTPFQP